jgi:NADH:ubiquinone oxidoreductase subunit B-like Fe-S oxidoreductase
MYASSMASARCRFFLAQSMSSAQPCPPVAESRCIWNMAKLTRAGTFWNFASRTACCSVEIAASSLLLPL